MCAVETAKYECEQSGWLPQVVFAVLGSFPRLRRQ